MNISITISQARPIPPGEVLVEACLEPRGITITELASASGLSRKHLSRIINGHVGITAGTAVRFAGALGTTPELWLNLQNKVGLYDAQISVAPETVRPLVAEAIVQ